MVTIKVHKAAFMLLLLPLLAVSTLRGAPPNVADQTLLLQQGRTATLTASPGGAAWQWLRDGQPINGAVQRSYVVTGSGRYQVVTYNSEGCVSETSDGVIVTLTPNATPSADVMVTMKAVQTSQHMDDPFKYVITVKNNGPDAATGVLMKDKLPADVEYQQMMPPTKGTANFANTDNTINWTMPQLTSGQSAELNVMVKGLRTGTITNTATVSMDETDSNPGNNIAAADAVLIPGLTIPNVFTPNGDGVNETFEIPGLENFTANDIVIVNRWGGTVFTKKNYKGDWDGSGLNEGTYFYVLRVQTTAGNWDTYKGYITLLRSKK